MSLFENEKIVDADIKKEGAQTLLAACLGLPLGLGLSVALPLYFLISGGPALMTFLFATFLAPSLVGTTQKNLREEGHGLLAEALGYFGTGLGVPLIAFWMGATPPMLFLISVELDRGNFKSAESLNTLLNLLSGNSPLTPSFLKRTYKIIAAKCSFYNGGAKQALDTFNRVVSEADHTYSNQPNTQNWEGFCLMAAEAIEFLELSGEYEQSNHLWSRLSRVGNTNITPGNTTAYAYDALARSACIMQDFEAALYFANVAADHYKSASMTSRLVSGNIALNRARAYLAYDRLDDAEKQANLALKEWGVYVNKTALLNADAYKVLGMIETKRANHTAALKHFDMAISIMRKRCGVDSPSVLLISENYAGCLSECGRAFESDKVRQQALSIREQNQIRERPSQQKVLASESTAALEKSVDQSVENHG